MLGIHMYMYYTSKTVLLHICCAYKTCVLYMYYSHKAHIFYMYRTYNTSTTYMYLHTKYMYYTCTVRLRRKTMLYTYCAYTVQPRHTYCTYIVHMPQTPCVYFTPQAVNRTEQIYHKQYAYIIYELTSSYAYFTYNVRKVHIVHSLLNDCAYSIHM